MKCRLTIAIVLVAVLALPTTGAGVYMKIEGLDGESSATDDGHKDWIIIESLSARMDIAPRSVAAGSTQPRADLHHDDFVLTKGVEKASPKLAEAVCKGKVFPKVEIDLTSTYGGSRATYLKYELENVRVTSYSVNASGDDGVPVENFALNFEEIKVTYDQQQGMASKSKGKVKAQWKVEEGEK